MPRAILLVATVMVGPGGMVALVITPFKSEREIRTNAGEKLWRHGRDFWSPARALNVRILNVLRVETHI